MLRSIEKAKACMRRCLNGMNPKDTFQIIRFSNHAEYFAPQPILNTPENVADGLKYVDALAGNGGTEMLDGVRAALHYPHDPGRQFEARGEFAVQGVVHDQVPVLHRGPAGRVLEGHRSRRVRVGQAAIQGQFEDDFARPGGRPGLEPRQTCRPSRAGLQASVPDEDHRLVHSGRRPRRGSSVIRAPGVMPGP